jgi:pimeloyl-ACP methyl ester carboxylesterase
MGAVEPERIVHVNGVDLCVQEFGAPGDPRVLLIGGAAMSMDWWPDELCERLAGGGRRVVRYDLRDTGRSTASPAGRPTYTGQDLEDDAVALIGDEPAHLVGISMGGGLAQSIALDHPDRVRTLTLLSTSPVNREGADLPPPTPALRAHFAEQGPPPDWTDRDRAIDAMLAELRLYAGGYGVDEPRTRALVARVYHRTADFAASQTNHWILGADGEPERRPMRDIAAPTLVLHGTDDPLFPIAHGEALARAIPGATLVPLDKVGHEVPPPQAWDVVVDAILRHTA